MVKKARTRQDIEFVSKFFSVLEGFRYKNQPYLVYLRTRHKGDEFLIRDNIVKPFFVTLGYDLQKDFAPEETIDTGRADLVILNKKAQPIVVIETLHSASTKTEWAEHRKRLLDYTRELNGKLSVLTNGVRLDVFSKTGNLFISLDVARLYRKFLVSGMESLESDEFESLVHLRFLVPEHQAITEEDLLKEPELDICEESTFRQLLQELKEDMQLVKEEVQSQFDLLTTEYREYRAQQERYGQKLFPSVIRKAQQSISFMESFENWCNFSGFQPPEVKKIDLSFQITYSTEAREKFVTETMYVLMNRILLMRICEDKGIIERRISNGGIQKWLDWKGYTKFAGINYTRLLKDSYEFMQTVYPHLYRSDIFDWYSPSSDVTLDVLFTFNRYNFKNVDRDVLGKLYESYLEPKERKRLGQFYTPEAVIDYILNAVDYTAKHEIEGKKLLDPACGSGGFLVRAAKTLVEKLRSRGFGAETILSKVRDNLYGFDINPFAAHLAETNLLFQVIDLIREAKDKNPNFEMERFNIYPTDSLKLPAEAELQGDLFKKKPSDLQLDFELVRKIKLKVNQFAQGFDFIVGNPPYLKARDPGAVYAQYRKSLEKNGRYKTLYQMWDIYVPFIELGFNFLKKGGRFGFIVSDSFEKAKYATQIRKLLLEKARVLELSFFRNAKLFEEASVHNVILIFEKETPTKLHKVKRILHDGEIGKSKKLKSLNQIQHGEALFRSDYSIMIPKFDLSNTIDLCQICYVSYGLRLNSDERFWRGEFKKRDLISDLPDVLHQKAYVEGKDIDRYQINRVRYVEWNTERVPRKIVRPTFPELYEGEKLLLARVVGERPQATFDSSGLVCDCTIIVAMPWVNLRNTNNKSIEKEVARIKRFYHLKEKHELSREKFESNSLNFDLKYVLAVVNSKFAAEYLRPLRRSKVDICPEDYKRIPIKYATFSNQREISALVDQLIKINEELPALEIKTRDIPSLLVEWKIPIGDLADVAGVTVSIRDRVGVPKTRREGMKVFLDKRSYFECKNPELSRYLELYLGSTSQTLRGKTQPEVVRLICIPQTPESLSAFLQNYSELLARIENLKQKRKKLDREIDRKIYILYGLDVDRV